MSASVERRSRLADGNGIIIQQGKGAQTMITRDEILRRARAVPQRSDEYSQARLDGDGDNATYRPDCSGWVSYCWGCPTSGPGTWGGYTTATLVTLGIMHEIPRSELQPGDAIGHCGPTTAGTDGHIALWLGKSGSQEHIIDMPGGWGPIEHTATWGIGGDAWNSAANIKAFRFRGVEGASGEEDGPMRIRLKGFPGTPTGWDGRLLAQDSSAAGFHVVEEQAYLGKVFPGVVTLTASECPQGWTFQKVTAQLFGPGAAGLSDDQVDELAGAIAAQLPDVTSDEITAAVRAGIAGTTLVPAA
jgi:hypothetical protein